MSHACWQVLPLKWILFSHQNRESLCTIKPNGAVEVFAGCEREKVVPVSTTDGHLHGVLKGHLHLWCPDKNSIKICTKMVEYAKFLNSVGQLFDTFSIHYKGTGYSVKSADEALSLVRQCKELLERNTNEIRMSTGITSATNGPQGHVSARTVASVTLLEWGPQRLFNNLQPFN